MCTCSYKYCSAHSFALREKKWWQMCWSALYFPFLLYESSNTFELYLKSKNLDCNLLHNLSFYTLLCSEINLMAKMPTRESLKQELTFLMSSSCTRFLMSLHVVTNCTRLHIGNMQGIKEDGFPIRMQMHVPAQTGTVNHIVLIIRQLFPRTQSPIGSMLL